MNESRLTVSVIIPTYNRHNTLQRAIQSVLCQSYRDFEIIIVDDASDISPEPIVASFQDPRIRFIRHAYNKGANASRNTGIKNSLGEYISFLDSDDEWLPQKLALQINDFRTLPGCVGVHYTGLTVISSKGTVVGSRIPTASGDILKKLYANNCVGPLSSVIIRRSTLNHSGLFDEQLPSSQDWDLYIRIAHSYHFTFSEKPLLRYHLSNDSISKNVMSKALGRMMIINKYEKQMKTNSSAFSRQLIKTGHYYCRAGLIDNGRKQFSRAIRTYPASLKAYFFFVATIFGPKRYNNLVVLQHRLFDKNLN